jgi:hypothetical protein
MLAELEQKDERAFKALTGLSKVAFQRLLPVFERRLASARQAAYEQNQAERQRQAGGGRKGKLKTAERKLFFMLRYFKSYPTFDELAHEFQLDRSKACTNVHHLAPVLLQSLSELGVVPARHFSSLAEMKAAFAGMAELFIDATERPHVRPQVEPAQSEHYSGKKTPHREKYGHYQCAESDFVPGLHRGGQSA